MGFPIIPKLREGIRGVAEGSAVLNLAGHQPVILNAVKPASRQAGILVGRGNKRSYSLGV